MFPQKPHNDMMTARRVHIYNNVIYDVVNG